jgi:TRAP transporter TAXI family solute receptor
MFRAWFRAPGGAFVARLTAAAGFAALISLAAAQAQEARFFRIGTGAIGGAYFTIGGMLANAISSPPGARPCDKGGSCGVPGLVAVAQSTQGSVENVEAIASGALESALVQADVVYWAYHGTGLFQDQGPLDNLRAIANLFPAILHIVVRGDSFISDVAELRGKRISLGEEGSGTLVNARSILASYGISATDFEPVYEMPGPSSDLLADGAIDAFLVVGGVPVSTIIDLSERVPIQLLPINGTVGEEIKSFHPFFSEAAINAGEYTNVGHTATVGLSTQWIVSAEADEELVYELTKAMWHERNLALYQEGHPKGRQIRLDSALERVAIPLHPGAARFYQEQGIER